MALFLYIFFFSRFFTAYAYTGSFFSLFFLSFCNYKIYIYIFFYYLIKALIWTIYKILLLYCFSKRSVNKCKFVSSWKFFLFLSLLSWFILFIDINSNQTKLYNFLRNVKIKHTYNLNFLLYTYFFYLLNCLKFFLLTQSTFILNLIYKLFQTLAYIIIINKFNYYLLSLVLFFFYYF